MENNEMKTYGIEKKDLVQNFPLPDKLKFIFTVHLPNEWVKLLWYNCCNCGENILSQLYKMKFSDEEVIIYLLELIDRRF